ncbi:MAG: ABC transporter permease [Acidimicrobiales bacterium]
MRSRRVIALVAGRELRELLRTRTFRVVTVILLVGSIATVVIPRHVGQSTTSYDIGLVGQAPAGLADAVAAQGPPIGAQLRTRPLGDEAAATAALKAKVIDAALVDGERIVVRRADPDLSRLLNRAVFQERLRVRLDAAGLPADLVAGLVEPAPLPMSELAPDSSARRANESLAFAGVLLIYVALLSYGGMVSQGVAEEKAGRVSEVLLGAMRPHHLLAGKVAGIGAVGVVQLLAVGVPTAAVALVQGSSHLPSGTPLTFLAVLMWFVLGFGLYSCAYAAVGATASRPQEAAAASAPITFLVIASFGASFASLGDPDGTAARILSFIPPLTPTAMLPRAALGHVAPWEVPLSIVLVLVFTYGLVRLAGRVYAGAIVRTGPRVKLGDAWRSSTAPKAGAGSA